jgi:hypothetical protein
MGNATIWGRLLLGFEWIWGRRAERSRFLLSASLWSGWVLMKNIYLVLLMKNIYYTPRPFFSSKTYIKIECKWKGLSVPAFAFIMYHVAENNLLYSLRPIILFVNAEVSRHIIVIDTSVFTKSNMGRRE